MYVRDIVITFGTPVDIDPTPKDLDYADVLCLLTYRLVDMKEKGEYYKRLVGRLGSKSTSRKQRRWELA